jgi:hypothetical protein
MPNVASNQLFLLIRSMSKQEKRYFRIFSSRHSNEKNNYYTLYQVIERQDEYDEEAIIKLLKSHHFVNRLSIAKTRLYDQILKSLSSFHAQKSIDSDLFFTLQSIEILYSRALYKAAWKKLNSGIKIAEKHEKHEILLQFNKWKQKLIEKDNYQSVDLKHIEEWQAADKTILKQIKAYNALWHVKSKIFKILFYGNENSPKDFLSIQLLMEENIDPLDVNTLSVRSKFLYHHIHSAFNFAKKDLAESYKHLSQNLGLLDQFAWLFADNPYAEVSILSNMSYIGIKLGMKDEIKPIFDKMKVWNDHLDQSDENLRVRWFYSFYSIYLIKHINASTCSLEDAEIGVIQEGLDHFDDKIPELRKADLKMMLSVFYHKAGDNRLALKTVHDLLNELSSKQNQQLYFSARFYYLILLIELEKKDYFEVAWHSTKRMLKTTAYKANEADVLSLFFDDYAKKESINPLSSLSIIETGMTDENPFYNFKEWAAKKRTELNNALSL